MLSCRVRLMLCFLFLVAIFPAVSPAQNPSDAFLAMEEAGAAYLNDSSQAPGVMSAIYLFDNLELFTVIDIRSEASYFAGHIPGAYHSSLGTLIDDLAYQIPTDKPYMIACYTGQAAGHAKIAMEMLGYSDVYSLLFGMSAWNTSLDYWSQNCADNLTNPETENQNGNLTQYDYPDLPGNPETIVEDRVASMLDAGFKGISYAQLEQYLDEYFIINYFGEADYLGQGNAGVPGHIPGAFQFTPYASMGIDQMLNNIPTDQPVVVYAWTGQHSTQVVAYLNMLGYDAYSLKYGANGLFHSQLMSHYWSPGAMNDFPLEEGAGPSAVPQMEQPVVEMLGNHPNPFNPVTTISYQLNAPRRASLRIYDLSGHLVRNIFSGQEQSAGVHQFTWLGKNDAGQSMPSGTYLYRLEAGTHQESRRLMLLK